MYERPAMAKLLFEYGCDADARCNYFCDIFAVSSRVPSHRPRGCTPPTFCGFGWERTYELSPSPNNRIYFGESSGRGGVTLSSWDASRVLTSVRATALHFAMMKCKQTTTPKIFLENGANIDAQDKSGQTPLHLAVIGYPVDRARIAERMVTLLLENGANINIQDGQGWTPLHSAASHRFKGCVELLLQGGADASVVDNL